ncbi:MAG: isochorismate synthase, partial [Myxococcota bacterium]
IPAPRARWASFLGALPDDERVLWLPPHERGWAGIGAACRLEVTGRQWRTQLADAARALFDRLQTHALYGAPHTARLVGGLAFAPDAPPSPVWRAFGAGRFVLPRWTYSVSDTGGTLTVAVEGRPHSSDVAHLRDEAQRLLACLDADAFVELPVGDGRATLTSSTSVDSWRTLIDEIRAGVAEGRFRKVVAARHSELVASHPIDPLQVLSRLDAGFPDCFRFGMLLGGEAFVGATPERLVARRGLRIFADALAGSMAAVPSDPGAGDRLRADGKERLEHALVVEAIRETLSRFASHLQIGAAPQILTLRHVLHLHTPVVGELARPVHVLDLVEALHPTPAVGGLPRAEALAWIAAREGGDRGWYAGPVGWFDGHGDGEFAVAIRSALLAGDRARIYAGAGVVADSNAEAELAETELKQRAMLSALGYCA